MNKYYLNIKYEDRETAKTAGAKWDNTKKAWYLTNTRPGKLLASVIQIAATLRVRVDSICDKLLANEYVFHVNSQGHYQKSRLDLTRGIEEKNGEPCVYVIAEGTRMYGQYQTLWTEKGQVYSTRGEYGWTPIKGLYPSDEALENALADDIQEEADSMGTEIQDPKDLVYLMFHEMFDYDGYQPDNRTDHEKALCAMVQQKALEMFGVNLKPIAQW